MTEATRAETILDVMGSVLTRWTMGSAAAPAATFWRTELGDDPAEAELRLLALSGQFLGTSVTMEPASVLRVLPDIPTLALPTVPEELRPLVRRTCDAALSIPLDDGVESLNVSVAAALVLYEARRQRLAGA